MNVIDRIHQFNSHRIPLLLKEKYLRMRIDAFRFYRGTDHLFIEDNHSNVVLNQGPKAWLCGDLHLENFGVYKGDDRDLYFDINDFDEALLGYALMDLSRFLCSIFIARDMLKINTHDASNLMIDVLNRYTDTLLEGHARRIERGKATGILEDFMESLAMRKRKTFVNERTTLIKSKRQLSIIDGLALPAEKETKDKLKHILELWAADKKNPRFYNLIDAAVRLAGTGSVGLERYILLVEGKGGPDGNYLLDLKYAAPSSFGPFMNSGFQQPQWKNEAERVVTLQKRMQAVYPAMLDVIEMDGKSYIIKELQPSTDKLNLSLLCGKFNKLSNSLHSFADILAWAQLRSAGRQGSDNADALLDFAAQTSWKKPLIDFCIDYAQKVQEDYLMFSEAFDAHVFD